MGTAADNGQRAQRTTAELVRRRWRAVLGWGLITAGTIFIVLGWIGVSGEPEVARQLSYLASGGVGGLTAAIVGIGLLISEDLRSERRRLGRIEATLLDVSDQLAHNGGTRAKATKARGRG